ncbi:MAG: hypothetical protein IID32_12915, partial [Planctomycetes bacterium]|nr:hypothetical protein [Planctomycetota bacterium]
GDTMIVKKRVLHQVGYFREGLAYMEDLDMWWRIAYRWPQIGYVNQPLAVHYRMRPGSLTTEIVRKEESRYLCRLLNTHLPLAAGNKRLPEFKKLSERMLRYSVYPLYRDNHLDDIRILLSRYGHVFSLRQKIALNLMTTILPPSVPYAGEISRKLLGYKLPKRSG